MKSLNQNLIGNLSEIEVESLDNSSVPLPNPVLTTPFTLVTTSLLSSLAILYILKPGKPRKKSFIMRRHFGHARSTVLPGFGILGDRINEFIEIFLDALAIYVHNDREWDCPRRLLCEANQRAVDYGATHGVLMYLASLFVSFWLRDQRVSSSMEAMKRGRHGDNCTLPYPCPFSL